MSNQNLYAGPCNNVVIVNEVNNHVCVRLGRSILLVKTFVPVYSVRSYWAKCTDHSLKSEVLSTEHTAHNTSAERVIIMNR